jgi:hypothetical protein
LTGRYSPGIRDVIGSLLSCVSDVKGGSRINGVFASVPFMVDDGGREGGKGRRTGKVIAQSAERKAQSAIEFAHRPPVGPSHEIILSAPQVGQGFYQDDTLSRYHLRGKEIDCPYSALLQLLR